MSKELIEQLAKENGSRGNRNSTGDFLYEFTGTNLEAFAKAYAQTQGQSNWISVKDNDESTHADNLIKLNQYLIKLESYHDRYEVVYWTGYEFQHEETACEYCLHEVSDYQPIAAPIESGVKG